MSPHFIKPDILHPQGQAPANVPPAKPPGVSSGSTDGIGPILAGQFKTTRPVAYSLGVSLGLASYHAHTLIELVDNPQNIADLLSYGAQPREGVANLLCSAVKNANDILGKESAYALSRKLRSSPLKPLPDCDVDMLKSFEPDTNDAKRNHYNAIVAARETYSAQLLKQDNQLASAFNAGTNIAIAEGFASRTSDSTSIVRQGLNNAMPDVQALGLPEARLQEAINAAAPGANMKVLHDMVMSLRVSFEASL